MLLAIDTSTRLIGLALYREATVIHETVWASQNYHTMQLAPAIQNALTLSGQSMENLEAIGVALGPGSFTGLRIGLAVAKGLALARHIPLVGIPTMDILAAAQPLQALPLVITLQAGRGRIAAGWYMPEGRNWSSQGEPEVLTAEGLAERIETPTLVAGELSEEERHLLRKKRRVVLLATPAWSLRRPSFLAELAWRRWQVGHTDDPVTLAPRYLHYGDPIGA